ncbi:MAG: hypothetical protein U0237_11225 [Thermoleophilia bacterium]
MADPFPAPGVWLVHVPDTDQTVPAVHLPDEDAAMIAAAILLGRDPTGVVHLMSGRAGEPERRVTRALDLA